MENIVKLEYKQTRIRHIIVYSRLTENIISMDKRTEEAQVEKIAVSSTITNSLVCMVRAVCGRCLPISLFEYLNKIIAIQVSNVGADCFYG